MVIARGIMQVGRINIWPTSTIMSLSPPSPVTCTTVISFTVTVFNDGANVPPGTMISVIDTISGLSIIFDLLSPISANASRLIVSTAIPPGNFNLVAFYSGNIGGPDLAHQFKASKSNSILYNVNLVNTFTRMSAPPDGTSFSHSSSQSITAFVTLFSDLVTPITVGTVSFNLWSDDTTFTPIPGTASLNGSGHATLNIPANFTTPGVYYIQALYLGDSCHTVSQSIPGTLGLQLIST